MAKAKKMPPWMKQEIGEEEMPMTKRPAEKPKGKPAAKKKAPAKKGGKGC